MSPSVQRPPRAFGIDPRLAMLSYSTGESEKGPEGDKVRQDTVFIFPDLKAGNMAYEAVQWASNSLAMGPVPQGLNKLVTDLSRGASVQDIVNTIAITAIQAQSGGIT